MTGDHRWQFCRHTARIHHGVHRLIGRRITASIGLRQARILMTLVERGEVGQRELYDLFGIDRAVVTKSLQLLEDAGYVVRERDGCDKRRYILRPTPAGIAAVPVIEAAWLEAESTLTHGMNAQEKEGALRLLKRMGRNIETALATPKKEN
ncbi:MAG: winged helix-turn-helix transcriptional regulator [Clostridiales bacterium]|nr:winged helix-turn-helix transcriptional regulator [Clostridiales bacterium]